MILFAKFPQIRNIDDWLLVLKVIDNDICPSLIGMELAICLVLIDDLIGLQMPYIIVHYSKQSILSIQLFLFLHQYLFKEGINSDQLVPVTIIRESLQNSFQIMTFRFGQDEPTLIVRQQIDKLIFIINVGGDVFIFFRSIGSDYDLWIWRQFIVNVSIGLYLFNPIKFSDKY